jgi:hypothetical protein
VELEVTVDDARRRLAHPQCADLVGDAAEVGILGAKSGLAGTDPIPIGATPASSDRIAQRNLAIVESGNPGWPETHTVQHTFLLKPSSGGVHQDGAPTEHSAAEASSNVAVFAATAARALGPDELMIQWNNVPRSSDATFYLPEVDVDEILELSALRQHPTVLERVDAHTLRSKIADRSFIPLPGDRPGNLAGLISLTLPAGVATGQVFRLSVQQYSGTSRKVLGAFQINVPVKTDPEILPNEMRKLSVLRSIQESIPVGNRWHSIFVRYLDQIADRVRGFGGDPDAAKPSPDGGERALVMTAETREISQNRWELELTVFIATPPPPGRRGRDGRNLHRRQV